MPIILMDDDLSKWITSFRNSYYIAINKWSSKYDMACEDWFYGRRLTDRETRTMVDSITQLSCI